MLATPTLLLIRPQAQSERFAREFALRHGDIPVLIAPLIEIRPRPLPCAVEGFAGLIFTSENAVRAFAGQSPRRDLPAFCVGDTTAQAARQAGFAARSARGDWRALLHMLKTENPAGPFLHLRGEHVAGPLVAALNGAGISTVAAVIYDQAECALTPQARALLAGSAPVLLPLFSPRSARLLRAAAGQVAAPLHIAAISPAVADAWGAVQGPLVLAERPDGPGMQAALDTLIAAA